MIIDAEQVGSEFHRFDQRAREFVLTSPGAIPSVGDETRGM